MTDVRRTKAGSSLATKTSALLMRREQILERQRELFQWRRQELDKLNSQWQSTMDTYDRQVGSVNVKIQSVNECMALTFDISTVIPSMTSGSASPSSPRFSSNKHTSNNTTNHTPNHSKLYSIGSSGAGRSVLSTPSISTGRGIHPSSNSIITGLSSMNDTVMAGTDRGGCVGRESDSALSTPASIEYQSSNLTLKTSESASAPIMRRQSASELSLDFDPFRSGASSSLGRSLAQHSSDFSGSSGGSMRSSLIGMRPTMAGAPVGTLAASVAAASESHTRLHGSMHGFRNRSGSTSTSSSAMSGGTSAVFNPSGLSSSSTSSFTGVKREPMISSSSLHISHNPRINPNTFVPFSS